MPSEQLKLMVLVKAAPILASTEEAVCVAGMTLDEKPEWIRLFPIPFRDLNNESKFRKYQEIELEVTRPKNDKRPESRTPILDTIQTGEFIDTKNWTLRCKRVQRLGEFTMCDLAKCNKSEMLESIPSLSVVRTRGEPELFITEKSKEEELAFSTKLTSITTQQNFFDAPVSKGIPLEFIPWKFKYKYYCLDSDCNGHKQSIIDWEISALYRNVRDTNDWQQKIRAQYCDMMWSDSRDTVLFVGNQIQHPNSFLVIGIFRPPKSTQPEFSQLSFFD